MEFPSCLKAPNVGNTFCGTPISQAWQDLCLWEEVLNRLCIQSILELGTWHGGMATFLAIQCNVRRLTFRTVDRDEISPERKATIEFLGGRFVQADVFADSTSSQLLKDVPRPVLVFCDNGNKPLEFASFVPHLTNGDYIAVHDWQTEFHEADVVGPVEFFMKEECEAIDSMTRFFRVLEG